MPRIVHRHTSRAVSFALCALALLLAGHAVASDFGSPGGPEPANIAEVNELLHRDAYDLELLISFGTSKGGSAGHIALAIREPGASDDAVYSANFYADRSPEHEGIHYTTDLMVRVPKTEYLLATSSSLGQTASFGLDFGEVYKRSVVGIRAYGVPAKEKEGLANFIARINADYHRQAKNTEYHHGEIKYDYVRLNCAKTIGSAFRYGAGYADLQVESPRILRNRKVTNALNANVPTEMAMKILKEWNARGYAMDVVLYRKYPASTYVDSHEEVRTAFKDLPNRFPSVLSLDFRNDDGYYEDYDNLFAVYLLYNLARYSVRIDPDTRLLVVDRSKQPMAYPEAAARAVDAADADSKNFLRRALFKPKGKRIGEPSETAPVE